MLDVLLSHVHIIERFIISILCFLQSDRCFTAFVMLFCSLKDIRVQVTGLYFKVNASDHETIFRQCPPLRTLASGRQLNRHELYLFYHTDTNKDIDDGWYVTRQLPSETTPLKKDRSYSLFIMQCL